MKRLIVVRHSKATHKPGFDDIDRPLTGRGRRDAAAAGTWLRERDLIPGLALCSPARRTRETWDRLTAALGATNGAEVYYDERLYLASAAAAFDILGTTPDDVATLLLVGHNPTAQQIAAGLTGQGDLAFPTSATAVIELGSWARLVPGAGSLEAYWSPASAG
ncbi:MAG TPA: histidine phosphatase family protein [Streptosporangiaceae bacterium]